MIVGAVLAVGSLALLWTTLMNNGGTENSPPVIEGLTAESMKIEQGESIAIQCIASDSDEDELSYRWLATGGSIQGEGANITWTSPNRCSTYSISVRVTDDRGGVTSDNVSIIVAKPG